MMKSSLQRRIKLTSEILCKPRKHFDGDYECRNYIFNAYLQEMNGWLHPSLMNINRHGLWFFLHCFLHNKIQLSLKEIIWNAPNAYWPVRLMLCQFEFLVIQIRSLFRFIISWFLNINIEFFNIMLVHFRNLNQPGSQYPIACCLIWKTKCTTPNGNFNSFCQFIYSNFKS